MVDDENQRFILYYHGDQRSIGQAPTVHERFVATSATGLNFNDPISGNGEIGHGPVEVTSQGTTVDLWIGEDYMQVFQKNGRFYGVGKRGIINAAPDPATFSSPNDLWTPNPDNPFGEPGTAKTPPKRTGPPTPPIR